MRVYMLLLSILTPLVSIAHEGPPRLLRSRHNAEVALWVEETAAFDSAGRLRGDLWFSAAVRQNLKMNASGTCGSFVVESPLETFDESRSLVDIAQNALAVLSGEVVSLSPGFFHGFPGTLVGFRVAETVRPRGDVGVLDVGRVRYTFIGKAQIITPHGAICSTTGLPVTLPELGDTIMISSYLSPPDEKGLIIPIHSQRHLIIERDGQRVYTPTVLVDELAGATIPDAMHRIREVANRAQRQPR